MVNKDIVDLMLNNPLLEGAQHSLSPPRNVIIEGDSFVMVLLSPIILPHASGKLNLS